MMPLDQATACTTVTRPAAAVADGVTGRGSAAAPVPQDADPWPAQLRGAAGTSRQGGNG